MNNGVQNNEIWLNASEACKLLNVSKETFRRNCKANKYVVKSERKGKAVNYSILLTSLPEEIQDKYFSELEKDKDLDIEIYSDAPAWAKTKADKYLSLFQQTQGLRGKELKAFIKRWNKENPEHKTSYASYMAAKKKYKEYGVSALLANYVHNRGKSILNNSTYEYYKSLYLKEGAPSAHSCWLMALGYAKRHLSITKIEFPSLSTFKRRLKSEIPEQAIYLARYGESAWNKKYAMYLDRDYSNVLAGEAWVSDHAQIDVMVMDENGNVSCPWVTVWRDFKSSKWLAWEVYLGNPNSDHIFQTFYYSAVDYGLPKWVYIDNGKDYRAKDFAGGRSGSITHSNGKGNIHLKASPMLELLNVEVKFALPYNAQTKPIERDFLKNKEFFSKHMKGYRGGNVVERPEKLKSEIKNKEVLKFADFKILFDDFVKNVLNKMPSNGKNLRGKSPDELWSAEFTEKRVVSKDELKIFCMRTSKTFTIGRNGIKDSEFDLYYWGEWMVPYKGEKVYIRRDSKAYQEAWVFRAQDDEYLGIANALQIQVSAKAESDIDKETLKKAFAIKKREKKLAKEYIKTRCGYDHDENMKNLKAAISQTEFENKAKVSKISRTKMSEAIAKDKLLKKQDKVSY